MAVIEVPPIELPVDRAVLLLDIDGVINVFQRPEAVERKLTPDLLPFRLLPGIEEWLAQLDRAFYLVWCSTLGALVNRGAAQALGLEPRPVMTALGSERRLVEWKSVAVERTFTGWSGGIVWVQDGFLPEAFNWATARTAAGARTWLVDVTPTGLTAAVTSQLLQWASAPPPGEFVPGSAR